MCSFWVVRGESSACDGAALGSYSAAHRQQQGGPSAAYKRLIAHLCSLRMRICRRGVALRVVSVYRGQGVASLDLGTTVGS